MSGDAPFEDELRKLGDAQREAFTAEQLFSGVRSQYLAMDAECQTMRDAFNRALQRLKTVNPKYKFNQRSTARRLDTAMQNFCNEARRLAAEFDQAQQPK